MKTRTGSSITHRPTAESNSIPDVPSYKSSYLPELSGGNAANSRRRLITFSTSFVCASLICLGASAAFLIEERSHADPKLEDLPSEAQRIVTAVNGRQPVSALCDGGVEAVKDAVRQATLSLMFSGKIQSPRKSGTAAGRYLVARCRKIQPDF